MTLITCPEPECNYYPVSDTGNCPKCGCNIPTFLKNKKTDEAERQWALRQQEAEEKARRIKQDYVYGHDLKCPNCLKVITIDRQRKVEQHVSSNWSKTGPRYNTWIYYSVKCSGCGYSKQLKTCAEESVSPVSISEAKEILMKDFIYYLNTRGF